MKSELLIAPSILSADFGRLAEEIRDVERGGCDALHIDVMDGHFVPNLTIGPPVIRSIRKITKLPLDVHLMIDDPIRYVRDYREAGADWITVHVEACRDVAKTLAAIGQCGAKKGLSLKPRTLSDWLTSYLKELDLVLVMTVEPGFGGQSFMPPMMEKVKALRAAPEFSGLVSVDGGINPETALMARRSGAQVLVAGTSIFSEKDRALAIKRLRASE